MQQTKLSWSEPVLTKLIGAPEKECLIPVELDGGPGVRNDLGGKDFVYYAAQPTINGIKQDYCDGRYSDSKQYFYWFDGGLNYEADGPS